MLDVLYSCNMIIFWAITLLEEMMPLSFLLYKSWLRLVFLAHQNHARKWFSVCICNSVLWVKLSNSISYILVDTDGVAAFLSDWNSLLERFLPRQISMTRAKREWEYDIISRYRSLVWENHLFILSLIFIQWQLWESQFLICIVSYTLLC